RSVGGAPLLGVRGLVFIGHGRSDAEAVAAALRVAARAVRADLLEQLSGALTQLEPAALKG
ncbi:MAG: phosphate acyltransferase, partial [Candidatus Dormiibacterota bacterium]